jgi:hypothetical protein
VPGFTLHFNAVVPAFGFSFYTVSSAEFHKEADSAASANAGAVPDLSNTALDGDFLAISNEYLTLSFSRETNLLSFVTDVKRNATISCSQKLMYYEAEGHLLVDMKHKRCVCIFRVFFLMNGTTLYLNQLRGLCFPSSKQFSNRIRGHSLHRCCRFVAFLCRVSMMQTAVGSPGGVQEVRLQFASWAGITYRLQPDMAHVDMVK